MRNCHTEAHRQQSSCNQSYQRGQIDVAKHPMTERDVASCPCVGKSTCKAYRQSDGCRSADCELRFHAGSLKKGVNNVPPPIPARAAMPPKARLKIFSVKERRAAICNAANFDTSITIKAAAKN